MTYQQARCIAIIKRILGWIIFIPALLSTSISTISFIYQYCKNISQTDDTHELYLVFKDFIRVFLEMIRTYTSFLDYFWNNSPLPTLSTGWSSNNIFFIAIYILIFVGLALMSSGARMSRQLRHVREHIEDMAIVEQTKGDDGLSYQALMQKVKFPHHTILLQFFRLYILPAAIAAAVYFMMIYLQKMGF